LCIISIPFWKCFLAGFFEGSRKTFQKALWIAVNGAGFDAARLHSMVWHDVCDAKKAVKSEVCARANLLAYLNPAFEEGAQQARDCIQLRSESYVRVRYRSS
jgi:hypothetical protein